MRQLNSLLCGALLIAGVAPSAARADFEIPSLGSAPDTRPKQRSWDLSLRSFASHEDNVALDPDTASGKASSPSTGMQFDGVYRPVQTKELTIGLELRGEDTTYTSSDTVAGVKGDANDYSFWDFSPRIWSDYRFKFMQMPMHAGFLYVFHYEEGANTPVIGLTSQTFHTTLGFAPVAGVPDLKFDTHYFLGLDNYQDNGPDPAHTSRDAVRYGFEFETKYAMDRGERNLGFRYRFLKNDAKGTYFNFEQNYFDLTYETHLFGPLWGATEIGVAQGVYEVTRGIGGAPSTRHGENEITYSLKLLWIIDDHWSADFWYTHSEFNSDLGTGNTHGNSTGTGLTYRF